MNKLLIYIIVVVILVGISIILFSMLSTNMDNQNTSNDNSNSTVATNFSKVSPIEFKSRIEKNDSILIDLRTKSEISSGFIANPVNIDFYSPTYEEEIKKLDRNAKYLIYCNSGNRSGQVLSLMKSFGFTDVTDLQGGISAWKLAGLEINQ